MNSDQQRVKDVLTETIRLLCRTGLHYQHCLKIQGLLGITVDDDQILLIHMNDSIAGTSPYIASQYISGNYSLLSQSPDVTEVGSTTATHQSGLSSSEKCCASVTGDQMCVDQFVDQVDRGNVSSDIVLPDGSQRLTSCNIATESLPASPDHSVSVTDERVADPSGDLDCECDKNCNHHVEGCLTTNPVSNTAAAGGVKLESALEQPLAPMLQVSSLPADGHATMATTQCVSASVLGVESKEDKTCVTKTTSATSCAVVDMSTDVQEEQVVTEEAVANASAEGNDCYVPRNASKAISVTKSEKLDKPTEVIESDESFSDDSDDDIDSELSESDNLSGCQLTQSERDSGGPVAGVSQWSPSVQRSLSEPYAGNAAWSLSSGILAGVIPPGGPHSAAYYQQQVDYLFDLYLY